MDNQQNSSSSGLMLRLAELLRIPHLQWWVVAVLFVAFACMPFAVDRSLLRLLVEMATILALSMLWNLLAGYAGLISVGQQAFVGLGGYALFGFIHYAGLSPLLGIPVAALFAAAVSVPTALLLFRLRGPYFAVGSWVVAEVYLLLVSQVSSLGGGSGSSLPLSAIKDIAPTQSVRDMVIYYIAMGMVCGTWALVWGLLRSKFGLALTSIRDNETAAKSLGVNIKQTKMVVYVLCSFLTGAVGALIFLSKLRISPDAAFSIQDWTANIIFAVIIGGIGTIEGPFVGTGIYFLLRWAFSDFGSWYLIGLGLVAIGFILFAPQGLWGVISRALRFTLFPVQRLLNAAHVGPQR
jgi:branched-chain amino acid transport system permease protein